MDEQMTAKEEKFNKREEYSCKYVHDVSHKLIASTSQTAHGR